MLGGGVGAESEPDREIEREPHAERDRLAVQQRVAESGLGLERVAERVAEIEERPLALLALVGGDDLRFRGTAPQHRLAPRGRVAGDETGAAVSSQSKKARSRMSPYFTTSA